MLDNLKAMKKLIYILLFVPVALFGQEEDLYSIPDPDFLYYLEDSYPQVIVNDSLSINAALNISHMVISYSHINSLDGLQYFTNLYQLIVSNVSNLEYIPELSVLNITNLRLYDNNDLIFLPNLFSSNLAEIDIHGNNSLINIPELSFISNLTTLIIQQNNSLISIPSLYALSSLDYLVVDSNNNLTSFPNFSELNNLSILEILKNATNYNIFQTSEFLLYLSNY